MTSPVHEGPRDADGDGRDDVIITVRGLKNSFGEQIIHEGLDLDVRRGEILGVVGGSGTGKSVLMCSIIGLQIPAVGSSRNSSSGSSANALARPARFLIPPDSSDGNLGPALAGRPDMAIL